MSNYDQMTSGKGISRFKFPLSGYLTFIGVLILFGVCTKYDDDTILTEVNGTRTIIPATAGHMMGAYGMMMDATAMCVMGFGFLYAFCRKYTWGGISMNFLICGLCFLWCQVCSCIVGSIFAGEFQKAAINIASMIGADLVTAAVLITLGVVYGFISPCQLLVICLIEPIAMKFNEYIVVHYLHTSDAGGSLLTHTFGAFFGIGITLGLGVKPQHIPGENRKTSYLGDTFALLGTIVLWMFWPSFNGALLYDDVTVQQRTVVNTYLAICASCVTGMVTSNLIHGKFSMLEVQNATLAGGVAIGMSCSYNVQPWVPVLIGGLAGAISAVGYGKFAEFLEGLGVMDSAGACQLHGFPGIFGALSAAAVVVTTTGNQHFAKSTQWTEADDNTNGKQFGMIMASIVVTLVISFVTGLVNGLLIRIPFCDKVPNSKLIDESPYFELEESENGVSEEKSLV